MIERMMFQASFSVAFHDLINIHEVIFIKSYHFNPIKIACLLVVILELSLISLLIKNRQTNKFKYKHIYEAVFWLVLVQ